MGRNITVILYRVFLVLLLFSQLFDMIFNDSAWYFKVSDYIISLYIIFRLYIFNKLCNKATGLSMTLGDFLYDRSIYYDNKNCNEKSE